MDIPGPQNARGRILYDLVEHTENLQEVTILDISDYHGQLIPLAEASDTRRPDAACTADFAIGGAAFLKKYFEVYEAEAALTDEARRRDRDGRRRLGRCDAADLERSSATRPTIEIMNMMGIDIDGLGNHNFDSGADYLREHAHPAGGLPVRLGEHRRRERQDAEGVVAVARCSSSRTA